MSALETVQPTGTVNLNIDQKTLDACLKPISNFTSTTYQNVCTGQQVIVPTGVFDYMLFFAFIVPLAMFVFFGCMYAIKEMFFYR